MDKNLDYYSNLPYTIELTPSEGEGWFVRVKELPGCMSQGDTAEEALEMIQEAKTLWLGVALEDGLAIPQPRPEEEYSGKFVVRLPRSLHRELVERAQEEGVSLNQFVSTSLARVVGTADMGLAHRPRATSRSDLERSAYRMRAYGQRTQASRAELGIDTSQTTIRQLVWKNYRPMSDLSKLS
jgi:antitoxin HicB